MVEEQSLKTLELIVKMEAALANELVTEEG